MQRTLLTLAAVLALAGLGVWGAGLVVSLPAAGPAPAAAPQAPDIERQKAENEDAERVPLTESDC